MAQIGKEQAKPFDDLNDVRNENFSAAIRLARLWSKNHFRTEEEIQSHIKNKEKYEDIFWDDGSENDPINPKLDKII